MPSRFVALTIVVFWLAVMGWFVVRDILPHWRTGIAPPFSIELADEAVRQVVPVRWSIVRNDVEVGQLRTTLRPLESGDEYELAAGCTELALVDASLPVIGSVKLTIRNYDDRLRVSRDGELRGMTTSLGLTARVGAGPTTTATAELGADVVRGKLERWFRFRSPALGEFAPALEPGELIRGSVLNPLHPLHRLSGIRPGQHWRQPLVSPHEDIVRAALARLPGAESTARMLEQKNVRWLDAHVRSAGEFLEWSGGETECLVIDYHGDWHGDDYRAQTWIRRADGLVLRQVAESPGQRLVLQRE